MRKSKNIRTYAFQLHELPIKFFFIFPFHLDSIKKRGGVFALDLRKNATRCRFIIAVTNEDFKYFFIHYSR